MNRRIWQWITLRHQRRAPVSNLLLVLLLGTGVAAFLGVRLANRAAAAGFDMFTDVLAQADAQYSVVSATGSIPDAQLPEVRRAFGLQPATLVAVLEAAALLENDARVPLIGVDLVAAANIGGDSPLPVSFAPESDLQDALRGEPVLWVSQSLANRSSGSSLPLLTETGRHVFTVADVFPVERDLLLADIETVRNLTGRTGSTDRILVFPPPPESPNALTPARVEDIRNRLPDGLMLVEPGDSARTAEKLSAAFRQNLSALSLLALLVGMYLILQAQEAAVVRRRTETGILSALGVPARVIRRAWLLESMTLGAAGSALGVLLGLLLARLSVNAVGRTLSNLYVQQTVQGSLWSTREVLTAFALGLAASLLAGWLPARDAARTLPVQSLRRGARSLSIQLLDHPAYGFASLGLAGICLRLPPVTLSGVRFPVFGYLGAMLLAVGFAVLSCPLLQLGGKVKSRFHALRAPQSYAFSQLREPTGRHKLATAGLVVATTMAGGISLMIHSFEHTVSNWLDHQLQADLFVSARGFQHAGSTPRIPAEIREAILADPAVRDREWRLYQRISFQGEPAVLAGYAPALREENRPEPLWVTPPSPRSGLRPDEVPFWAGESFTRKFGLHKGDRVTLDTPSGPVTGPILGVFADYANEHGTLQTHAGLVQKWFGDDRTATLSLDLHAGEDRVAVRDRLRASFPGLEIRDQASLRREVFQTFSQTFGITAALKFTGIAVAVAGLALGQASLFAERRNELRVLREIGLSKRDLAVAGAWESGVMTLTGALTGLTAALGLGGILIRVINPQSFGWTLGYRIPWGGFAFYLVLILPAGVLTGMFTGLRAATWKAEHEA